MSKQLAAKFRKSSSLMLIAKNGVLNKKKSNYKILLFNRSEKATFMPNQAVFPGGVFELSDSSIEWRNLFQNCLQLNTLKFHQNINKDKLLPRITAIRETFEEVGIMLSRECNSLQKADVMNNDIYGLVKEDFDRHYWQTSVHNDSKQFFILCQKLNILPDVYNLHVWSNWLTPSTFQKRFDTTFYVVLLSEMPKVIAEETEVKNVEWKTPYEFLSDFYNKKIWLPPPQIYELSRLLNFNTMDDLREFLQNRQQKLQLTALLPVQFKCTNGIVSVLPGDDMYPKESKEISDIICMNKTIEEFSNGIKHLHRIEFFGSHDCVIRVNAGITDVLGSVLPINCNPSRK